MLSSPEPWHFMPHCSVSLESSWWVGVHKLGLRLFGATVWTIIEPLSQWKLNKIETEKCIGIWGCSWCCRKAFETSYLIEFISQFSDLRCERYLFWSGFCYWKFKQIGKFWVWKEESVEPLRMCHTVALRQKKNYGNSKNILRQKEELQKLKKYPKAKEELQKLKKYLRQKKNYGNSKSI